jgi:hypothetical protein
VLDDAGVEVPGTTPEQARFGAPLRRHS